MKETIKNRIRNIKNFLLSYSIIIIIFTFLMMTCIALVYEITLADAIIEQQKMELIKVATRLNTYQEEMLLVKQAVETSTSLVNQQAEDLVSLKSQEGMSLRVEETIRYPLDTFMKIGTGFLLLTVILVVIAKSIAK